MARGQRSDVTLGDCEEFKIGSSLLMSEALSTVGSSEFVTAAETTCSPAEIGSTSDSAPPTSGSCSSRIQRMLKCRSEFDTELEFEIESSKDHWSELVDPVSVLRAGQELVLRSNTTDEPASETNQEVFDSFQGTLWGGRITEVASETVVLGDKIAEGGQAVIYEFINLRGITINGVDMSRGDFDLVLKVFKEGFSPRQLQKQWPPELLDKLRESPHYLPAGCCGVGPAYLLPDGRFAFAMQRCWGDLRKVIDIRLQHNPNQRPFSRNQFDVWCMSQIARGMRALHKDGIIHRDLKASNVLVIPYTWLKKTGIVVQPFDAQCDDFACVIADFESSIGIVGTGFWRAPEILKAVNNRSVEPVMFTQQTDLYTYGMTCYEIITGRLPFEDRRRSDYDIGDERPELPSDIEPPLRELLHGCWHSHPSKRPTFEQIVVHLETSFDMSTYIASYNVADHNASYARNHVIHDLH